MRAALYARMACPTQQREPAIGSQLEALRNHAASRGMKIIEEFRDEGYGGPRLDRPGPPGTRFGRALRFDVLLTHAPDRLARDSTPLGLILEELARFGVRPSC